VKAPDSRDPVVQMLTEMSMSEDVGLLLDACCRCTSLALALEFFEAAWGVPLSTGDVLDLAAVRSGYMRGEG
jgi:hypothetical protein